MSPSVTKAPGLLPGFLLSRVSSFIRLGASSGGCSVRSTGSDAFSSYSSTSFLRSPEGASEVVGVVHDPSLSLSLYFSLSLSLSLSFTFELFFTFSLFLPAYPKKQARRHAERDENLLIETFSFIYYSV